MNDRKNDRVRELLRRLESYDEWERGHAERVAVYAVATAYRLGIRGDDLVALRWAAELHDVGKLACGEGRPIHDHPILAAPYLEGFPALTLDAVRHHHERLDGTGYPDGLSGPILGLPAQVVGLAEWYDVALHGAPFAAARPFERVAADLRAGRMFAPEAVEALLTVQRVIQPVGY